MKGEHTLAERALFVLQMGMVRENLLAVEILCPEACRRDHVLAPRRKIRGVRQREERNAFVVDLLDCDLLFERPVRNEVAGLVQAKTGHAAEYDLSEFIGTRFLLTKGG